MSDGSVVSLSFGTEGTMRILELVYLLFCDPGPGTMQGMCHGTVSPSKAGGLD